MGSWGTKLHLVGTGHHLKLLNFKSEVSDTTCPGYNKFQISRVRFELCRTWESSQWVFPEMADVDLTESRVELSPYIPKHHRMTTRTLWSKTSHKELTKVALLPEWPLNLPSAGEFTTFGTAFILRGMGRGKSGFCIKFLLYSILLSIAWIQKCPSIHKSFTPCTELLSEKSEIKSQHLVLLLQEFMQPLCTSRSIRTAIEPALF